MNKINKIIVETFEKEQPSLCAAIKQAVIAGESRGNFERFAKRVIGSTDSLTFNLSMTVFDYYSSVRRGNL